MIELSDSDRCDATDENPGGHRRERHREGSPRYRLESAAGARYFAASSASSSRRMSRHALPTRVDPPHLRERHAQVGQPPDAQQAHEMAHFVLLVSVVSAFGFVQQAEPVIVPDRVDCRPRQFGELTRAPGHDSSLVTAMLRVALQGRNATTRRGAVSGVPLPHLSKVPPSTAARLMPPACVVRRWSVADFSRVGAEPRRASVRPPPRPSA